MVDPLDVKFAALTAEFEKLTTAAGDQKAKKGVINTTKMFKAIKESGGVVADLLTAFQNAGTAKDVFQSVVSDYASYLSDAFWGEILTSIDFESITGVISDKLAPAFETIGESIGEIIESEPVANAIDFFTDAIVRGLNLISGNWDALRDDLIAFQQEREETYVTPSLDYHEQIAYEELYGIDFDALNLQAALAGEGGIADFATLDMDLIANMLGVNPDTQDQILEETRVQNDRIGRLVDLMEDQIR